MAVAPEAGGGLVALRRIGPEDVDLVLAWRAEPSTGRFQPIVRRGRAELGDLLAARESVRVEPTMDGTAQWIVLAGGVPVGWVRFTVTMREHGVGDLGYTIGERFRRRGYATAGLRALLPFAFGSNDADLARLEAVAAVANVASGRVLERCGFRCEGVARAYLVIGGERVDHARYALLRPEWEARRAVDPRG